MPTRKRLLRGAKGGLTPNAYVMKCMACDGGGFLTGIAEDGSAPPENYWCDRCGGSGEQVSTEGLELLAFLSQYYPQAQGAES